MPSSIEVESDLYTAMSATEVVILELGGSILTRKPHKVKAILEHPDGFTCKLSIEYVDQDGVDILEINRRSGDGILFQIVLTNLRAQLSGGRIEQFYQGQMCPRIVKLPCESPPLEEVPDLSLDMHSGEKRKMSECA